MPKLFLIRTDGALNDEWQYQKQTQVLVFGDIAGYRHFQRLIRRAQRSRKNIHVKILDRCKTSMQCVILPATSSPSKGPKLKFLERKIFVSREPEMELIVLGNRRGYQLIDRLLEHLITKFPDEPDDHSHLDQKEVVDAHGATLNIRGPLTRWNRKGLRLFADVVYGRQWYFPDEWQLAGAKKSPWLEPYREPKFGKEPYVL